MGGRELPWGLGGTSVNLLAVAVVLGLGLATLQGDRQSLGWWITATALVVAGGVYSVVRWVWFAAAEADRKRRLIYVTGLTSRSAR